MELIRKEQLEVFQNSGVVSQQLLFPENSDSTRVTITRVTVSQGATNPPHRHALSEQIWVALSGEGALLVEGDLSIDFAAGDVARFADGDLHGFKNTGTGEFVYLSVTSPPLNFRAAYQHGWSQGHSNSE